jgi:hypothetical protein
MPDILFSLIILFPAKKEHEAVLNGAYHGVGAGAGSIGEEGALGNFAGHFHEPEQFRPGAEGLLRTDKFPGKLV